jgi:hypothetical protein
MISTSFVLGDSSGIITGKKRESKSKRKTTSSWDGPEVLGKVTVLQKLELAGEGRIFSGRYVQC